MNSVAELAAQLMIAQEAHAAATVARAEGEAQVRALLSAESAAADAVANLERALLLSVVND